MATAMTELYDSRRANETSTHVDVIFQYEAATGALDISAGETIDTVTGLTWASENTIAADTSLFVIPTVVDIQFIPHVKVGYMRVQATFRGMRIWA